MKFRIIDFHAHISSAELFEELKDIGKDLPMDKTVLVSGNMLEPGKLGDFLRGSVPLNSTVPNNEFLLDLAKKNPGEYAAFFTIDPDYHTEDDLLTAVEDGFQGFKFNTVVHKVEFNSSNVLSLLSVIKDMGCPVYTHITLNTQSNLDALIMLARKFRNLNFIIGHMGFSTSDFAAITAVETNENIYLESSIGSMLAYKEVKRRGLCAKLLFGSEFPSHNPCIEYNKLKYIFNETEIEQICFKNAQKLLGWKEK